MEVKCYVYRKAIIAFVIDACAYPLQPSKVDIYNTIIAKTNNHDCLYGLGQTGSSWETYNGVEYDIYKYKFQTGENHHYLAVGVKNTDSLHYLGIEVYSEKGMAAASIVLIILLPVILVIALVVFLLRRCGCIVTVSSSSI